MVRFQRIVFALVLGFCGVIALSYMPKELIATSQVIMESTAQVISSESTENNAVEVNGVQFEILVPERVWTIPSNQSGAETPVKIGIRITNNTQQSVRFTWLDPLMIMGLQIIKPDGKPIQRQGGRDGLFLTGQPQQVACPLVLPGNSLTFFFDAKLYWLNNILHLGGSDGLGGGWYFSSLEPSTYQVRLIYENPYGVGTCYNPETMNQETYVPDIVQGLWTGQAITPLVKVRIVEP